MTTQKRKDLMKQFAENAKRYDLAGDAILREGSANNWRELATEAEAKRAPRYIWWTGRRHT
jgi:hypothetical protein